MTFEEICKLSKDVTDLYLEATATRVLLDDGVTPGRVILDSEEAKARAAKRKPDPNFCREQLWFAIPGKRGYVGLRFLLRQFVGAAAQNPALRNDEALAVAEAAFLAALPRCNHEPDKIVEYDGMQLAESLCTRQYPTPDGTCNRDEGKEGIKSLIGGLKDAAENGVEESHLRFNLQHRLEKERQNFEGWSDRIVKQEPAYGGSTDYLVRLNDGKPGLVRTGGIEGTIILTLTEKELRKRFPNVDFDYPSDMEITAETIAKIEDKNEPIYIVNSEDEKNRVWCALLDERWRQGKLSKWYAHNAIWTCDASVRAKILATDDLKFTGAPAWKTVVMTFKDEELGRKLATACAGDVFTVENPQTMDDVYKEFRRYAPTPVLAPEDEDKLPEFPRLPGPLGELVDGITHDLAYDHKALAVLTYVGIALAGRIKITSDSWLQTRFYSCMVGPPGSGKSAPDVEVQRALFENELGTPDDELNPSRRVVTDVRIELSIDSGPALVQALSGYENEYGNARVVIAPDEMADQFEKAKTTGTGKNSLFGELLKLYEGNKTANRTKEVDHGKKKTGGLTQVNHALLAIMGSVTDKRFEAMWAGTGSVSSGLQSRFVYSYSEKVPPRVKTPNDDKLIFKALYALADIVEAAKRETVHLYLSEAAQKALINWRPLESDADDSKIRIVDMTKRFAMLVAACNRATEIDGPTMRLALAFADYQIAIRTKLCPPDASSHVHANELAILKFFGKNPRATRPQVIGKMKPETRRGGVGTWNHAWDNLIKAGRLVAYGQSRKRESIWGLAEEAF